VAGNKTLRFLLTVFDTAPSVVGMMGNHQDTATLWSNGQHGGLLTINLEQASLTAHLNDAHNFEVHPFTGNTSTNLPAWFKIKRHFVDNSSIVFSLTVLHKAQN
jgi:hypothetical protein